MGDNIRGSRLFNLFSQGGIEESNIRNLGRLGAAAWVLSLTSQAYKKGLELEYDTDKRIPKVLLGDPARLQDCP